MGRLTLAEIVLHIGLPKTATSYLQRWLVKNAQALDRAGVWVPHQQMISHRIAIEAITAANLQERSDIASIRDAMSREEAFAVLAEAVRKSGASLFLMSSEYYWAADPAAALRQLAGLGLPTRIVVMLRRQDRIIESGYNQSVKTLGVTYELAVAGYQEWLDWFLLLSAWQNCFGKERIGVLNFDRSSQNGTVLADFMNRIDHRFSPQRLAEEFAAIPYENESLPADLLEFKRLANSFGEFGLDRFLYSMMEAGHTGPPFRLRPENAKRVIDAYRASNARVAKEVLNAAEPLFPEYGQAGEREGLDLYQKLPVDTLAKVLAFHLREQAQVVHELQAEIAALKKRMQRTPQDR
jgi:hypothetical protein